MGSAGNDEHFFAGQQFVIGLVGDRMSPVALHVGDYKGSWKGTM